MILDFINMENVMNFLKSVLYGVFLFLGIKTGTVKVLFWLMVIDSCLGIVKALRLGYGFSFQRLGWGIVLKLSLLLVPMTLALMAKGLNLDLTYFVLMSINILIVSEGISIVTNIISAKTKKIIENNDYVTGLLMSVRRFLVILMQKFFDSVNSDDSLKK